jgi:hypothetical protein
LVVILVRRFPLIKYNLPFRAVFVVSMFCPRRIISFNCLLRSHDDHAGAEVRPPEDRWSRYRPEAGRNRQEEYPPLHGHQVGGNAIWHYYPTLAFYCLFSWFTFNC